MLKTVDDVVAILRAGKLREHLHVNIENKEEWAQKHGGKMSALANKIGNQVRWLVVGVDDSGTLVRRDEKWVKRTEEIISQQVNANLDPHQACVEINCREVDGSWIIIVGLRVVAHSLLFW